MRKMLLLLGCLMVLLTSVGHAAHVNVPGFSGQSIPKVSPAPQASTPSVNIPGFYGSSVAPPPSTQLPVLRDPASAIPGIKGFETDPSQNQLIIHQDQPHAIIDWESFNIGADAWTKFDQQGNASWSALNRIWDRNPSLIFGRLTADGKIYLINQNGILFGRGSRIDVNSLVASALNITNDNFINNIFHFGLENYQGVDAPDELATVSNQGTINGYTVVVGQDGKEAIIGGSVFLLGPRVENAGLINAPTGQIGLAAGTDISLVQPGIQDLQRSALYVSVNNSFDNPPDATFGNAVNHEGSELRADGGTVGMYGSAVEQWGVIRSMTAFKNKQGQVELRAADKVTTGANSSISLPVNPSATDTVSDTFAIQPLVTIGGLYVNLTEKDTFQSSASLKQIELRGSIEAPTGQVTLNAGERVYMETGSRIDVSGVVADLPAPVIDDFKLNSVELRDAYGQKDGVLQGEKITTTLTDGSAIGDLSQAILTRDRTALERSIGGAMTKNAAGSYDSQTGAIDIQVDSGDIIIKQWATLDFSGGAILYKGSAVGSTKLLSGTKIYDISDAPLNLHYDMVLGQYKKTYDGFGVQETYSGIYSGGANPLNTSSSSYIQGGDAGKLTLTASTIVLDGQLNGSVTRGIFQNTWTAGGNSDALALSVARGLEAPRAGTLEIGYATENQIDALERYTTAISVISGATPQSQLNPDSASQKGQTTVLSADTLNNANLGTLNLYANLTITTAQDAHISLQPGGAFQAVARSIDHKGTISVPAGSITMNIAQNLTSRMDTQGYQQESYVPLEERIVLGAGSSLDVSGEKIDNTLAGNPAGSALSYGLTSGGAIQVMDKTDQGSGVFMRDGAVADVSGGYTIDRKGKVSGGNAGSLIIQGSNIILDGDLRGYALADADGKIQGGSVTLISNSIQVVTGSPSSYSDGNFVLAGNRFDDTGFTQINLRSINDIVFGPDATIAPSLVRLADPSSASGQISAGGEVPGRPDLVRLNDSTIFMGGASSITAEAGSSFEGSNAALSGNLIPPGQHNEDARLVISQGAIISTAPAASPATKISLAAPFVEVAGTLSSPGGNITVTATGASKEKPALILEAGGKILAGGYNRPDPASTPKGLAMNYQPVGGGSVTLSASARVDGDLYLSEQSFIDISGAEPVANTVNTNGQALSTYTDAGTPGSLSLSYSGGLTWEGDVSARARMWDIQGGSLSVNSTSTSGSNIMTVTGDDIKKYLAAGFDDLTLRSLSSLGFSGPVDEEIGRKLTLDAPVIIGSGEDTLTLKSPWIVLTNTYLPSSNLANGDARLTLSGQWVDVIGSTQFSGFQDVRLEAARDISLSEVLYDNNVISGKMTAAGNLLLDADRIYPGIYYRYSASDPGKNSIYPDIYSDYTIHAGGKVTIQNTSESVGGIIYSAGGTMTIEGVKGIEVGKGATLAAPQGAIILSAPGQRIYLADGSVLTTKGETDVMYGAVDSNNIWITQDKTNPLGIDASSTIPFTDESLPQKSITLNADETIIMKGASIDVSGGGSVYASRFEPGAEGSVDPLTKPGRYIVFENNSFQTPGTAVYLESGGGLSEGLYTMLPLNGNNGQNERFAFLPGAYIIEIQTGYALPASGKQSLTKDGYPLTIGYAAVADTSIQSTRPQVYSVRKASDVLTEGHYLKPDPFISGDAGNIIVQGKTAIIDGVFLAAASKGYQGGTISLSGTNIYVQESNVPLPSGFDFMSSVPDSLRGLLNVSASSLTGQGFHEIDLGNLTQTNSVTIREGSVLEAPVISINAKNTITLESGAELKAVAEDGTGEINLDSPNGKAVIMPGSLIHASDVINLYVEDPDLQGDIKVDNSALSLRAADIFFVPSVYTRTEPGLYITDSLWSQFTSIGDITLTSGSDVLFMDDFDLSAAGSVSIDAARIAGVKAGGTTVSLTAREILLTNSGTASTEPEMTNAGRITLTGDAISVGGGNILVAGFSTVDLNSRNDLTLVGAGSLKTNGADLNLTAARVTTTSGQNQKTAYIAPNFQVDAGSGAINISSSGGAFGDSSVPGGMLEFLAGKIDVSGVVDMPAGMLQMTATGSGKDDGIFLHEGGQVLTRGNELVPGGSIALRTENGRLIMEAGSLADVSAGEQGDAGVIILQAPAGGIAVDGALMGTAGGGAGGSLAFDTNILSAADMTKLAGIIADGGLNESLDIRSRTGDLQISSGTTIQSHAFKLTADGGNIDVFGNIVASSETGGGKVELYAFNDITLQSGGVIDVRGTKGDAAGGEVLLSSAGGFVNLSEGSFIYASGSGSGQGGTVRLRALRYKTDGDTDDVQMNLNGQIDGASAVYAEAVKVYDDISVILNERAPEIIPEGDQDSSSQAESPAQLLAEESDASTGYLSDWLADTSAFMENADPITARLRAGLGMQDNNLQLLPGIEVRSPGDLTLGTAWDLSARSDPADQSSSFVWRYGSGNNLPGVLTIRAGGNLTVSNNLVDHPTPLDSLNVSAGRDSWAFNLAAGADLASADSLAVVRGKGDLTIGDQTVVYTENGPVRFASGRDTVIGSAPDRPGYMINDMISYNLASYHGSIQGYVGRDLRIAGGAVQTATGNIDINVVRDLNLNVEKGSAIRTTGTAPSDPAQDGLTSGSLSTDYWRYAGGGDITLNIGRYTGTMNSSGQWVTGNLRGAGWDYFTPIKVPGVSNDKIQDDRLWQFSANYTGSATAGIATMGGGNLTIRTGGDFLSQAGTFGEGDLAIYAGGDIGGRFLSMNGSGELHTMGNLGSFDTSDPMKRVQIELFDSRMAATASGEIQIGAIVNPSLASDKISSATKQSYFVNCTYTENTSISLKSGGDITIAGKSPLYQNTNYLSALSYETVLPATVDVNAGGNISLLNDLTLASAPTGNLSLIADGNISGSYKDSAQIQKTASVLMSDIAPEYWYGLFRIAGTDDINGQWITSRAVIGSLVPNYHGFYRNGDEARQNIAYPLHQDDDQAIEIHAGSNIEDLKLYLPKKAEVTAGADILDIVYEGQNIHPEDVSKIQAGRNISMAYVKASTDASAENDLQPHEGLIQGGPGTFLVQAGGSIDLGSLKDGIQAVGSGNNVLLDTGESSLVVLSGYRFDKTTSDISAFFDTIRKAGDDYASLMAEGKKDEAEALLQETRENTISLFLGDPSGGGDIDMTSSQIGTPIGKSDIFIIANGNLNLGKTALPIAGTVNKRTGITTGGGGDINVFSRLDMNVNESRLMTFYGGDITLWSDEGNINAGRGSRTAVSASPPRVLKDGTKVFTPPAVGSGIRAVTYGDNPPPPGDIHLFAPQGVIDAGEAGISGGQIILAALQVVNAGNIAFSAGSVGVPQPAEGTAGIGSLSGNGMVVQGSQLMADASGIAGTTAAQASQLIDDIMTRWLDVRIIDYVTDDSNDDKKEE